MKDSKIVEILRGISFEMLNDLEHFLYFYTKTTRLDVAANDVCNLFIFLKSQFPFTENIDLDQEFVFEKIYPDKAFSKAKLAKLQSNLLKGIERFIVYTEVSKDEMLKMQIFAKFLDQKTLEDRFDLQIDSIRKALNSNNIYEHDLLWNVYITERLDFQQKTKSNNRKDGLNIQKSIESLDLFYIIARLEFTLVNIAQNRVTKLDLSYALSSLQEVFQLAEKLQFDKNEIYLIHFYALEVLINERYYDNFYNLLRDKKLSLSEGQRKMFHTIERNYLTAQYNRGKNEVLPALFELLKEHLNLGLLYYEGGLPIATLQNLMVISLKCKDYDWAEKCLNENAAKLFGTDDIDEIIALYHAQIAFFKKDFEKAHSCLPYVKFKDPYLEMALRRLEIMLLFEMNVEMFEARLEAFKNYLFENSKKGLPALIYELNNNFVNWLKRFYALAPSEKDKYQKLKLQLQEKATYAEREWLLEKIAEKI